MTLGLGGFSASNGQGSTVHIIDWLQFKTFGFQVSSLGDSLQFKTFGFQVSSLGDSYGYQEGDSFLWCYEDESINDYPFPFDPRERRKKAVEMTFGLGGLAYIYISMYVCMYICICVCVHMCIIMYIHTLGVFI